MFAKPSSFTASVTNSLLYDAAMKTADFLIFVEIVCKLLLGYVGCLIIVS